MLYVKIWNEKLKMKKKKDEEDFKRVILTWIRDKCWLSRWEYTVSG